MCFSGLQQTSLLLLAVFVVAVFLYELFFSHFISVSGLNLINACHSQCMCVVGGGGWGGGGGRCVDWCAWD